MSKTEFTNGFAKWFNSWDAGQTGSLTENQLRDGLNRDVVPPPPGRGRGFRGGNNGNNLNNLFFQN